MRPVKISARQRHDKPLRHVRIEHKKAQLSAEDSASWAVSYSDMLMVLMSFFIIFFSYDESKRSTILSELSTEMNGKVAKVSAKSPVPGMEEEEVSIGREQLQSMNESMKDAAIHSDLSAQTEELTIHLSDGLYEPRTFDLNLKAKVELEKVLRVLKPYNQKVRIVFIGHADSSTFRRGNKYLGNNFDLSALRASRAMALGLEMGFDIAYLSIEAEGSNLRNSRTLSLKIIPLPNP